MEKTLSMSCTKILLMRHHFWLMARKFVKRIYLRAKSLAIVDGGRYLFLKAGLNNVTH